MDGTEPLPLKDGEGCVLPPSENWLRFESQTGIPAGTCKSGSSTASAEQEKTKEAESYEPK
ncbi:hypothetical protein ACJ73_06936 [Blastomyces percursus]|uniref:Uncharacterized protein n=1 Tax=Blastomyces percursus TaxID=1658174 RepID=A0A1J9R117_9EURO|nr:hypothetical protein ACJ73_06936 [Blastomyces percursus]